MDTIVRRLAAVLLVSGLLLSSGVAHASTGPVPDMSTPWSVGPLELAASVFAHPENGPSPVRSAADRRPERGPPDGACTPEAAAERSGPARPPGATRAARRRTSTASADAAEGWARLLRARLGLLSSPHTAPPGGPLST